MYQKSLNFSPNLYKIIFAKTCISLFQTTSRFGFKSWPNPSLIQKRTELICRLTAWTTDADVDTIIFVSFFLFSFVGNLFLRGARPRSNLISLYISACFEFQLYAITTSSFVSTNSFLDIGKLLSISCRLPSYFFPF